jgi:hypothetical protein
VQRQRRSARLVQGLGPQTPCRRWHLRVPQPLDLLSNFFQKPFESGVASSMCRSHRLACFVVRCLAVVAEHFRRFVVYCLFPHGSFRRNWSAGKKPSPTKTGDQVSRRWHALRRVNGKYRSRNLSKVRDHPLRRVRFNRNQFQQTLKSKLKVRAGASCLSVSRKLH